MSSETYFAEFVSMFERMIIQQRGDGFSRLFPLILALAGVADEEDESTARQREIVMISPAFVFGEFLDGDFLEKQGKSPASKASVESMPRVVIGENKEKGGESCAICLEEWKEGDVAAEMPCKHEFHSKCVEEWLGIQATCPLCRYEMPVEEVEGEGKRVGVWIGFSVNGGERSGEEEEEGR